MIDIKKVISILLVICTLFSALPIAALALSWDGSSAGGSTNAVNGSSTGYVIRSTNVFLFLSAVPDPFGHCRQHRLTEAVSTRSFFFAP